MGLHGDGVAPVSSPLLLSERRVLSTLLQAHRHMPPCREEWDLPMMDREVLSQTFVIVNETLTDGGSNQGDERPRDGISGFLQRGKEPQACLCDPSLHGTPSAML